MVEAWRLVVLDWVASELTRVEMVAVVPESPAQSLLKVQVVH